MSDEEKKERLVFLFTTFEEMKGRRGWSGISTNLTDNNFGTLISGRLIEGVRLIVV